MEPKYDCTSAKAPPLVLDESQSITQPPNSGDPTLDDKDMRNWAERLGLSLDEFYKLVERQAARHRQPIEMIFRNFMFQRFQGVTYTDSTILNILQVEYYALPPALMGAYRISAVRGKGLGMFAAWDIPSGAVIVCENPVIVLPQAYRKKRCVRCCSIGSIPLNETELSHSQIVNQQNFVVKKRG